MWLMTSRDEEGQILATLDKNVRAPITQGGGFRKIFQVTSHGCRLWNYLQAKSVKLLGPFRRPADWFAEMRTLHAGRIQEPAKSQPPTAVGALFLDYRSVSADCHRRLQIFESPAWPLSSTNERTPPRLSHFRRYLLSP